MAAWLGIAVVDVNGDEVPGATLELKDPYGGSLAGVTWSGGFGQTSLTIFDLANWTSISITVGAPNYFSQMVTLTRDIAAGTMSVDARSPFWGLFATETIPFGTRLTLIASRIQSAPFGLLVLPARDQAPPVVCDPGGIIVDGSNRLDGLYAGPERGFQVVLGPEMLGSADADDWGRFSTTTRDVDPQQPDRGARFTFVEYGDPSANGLRLLLAVWVVNRAAQRTDGKADVHVFFCPSTGFDDFAPADLYPYKVRRIKGVPDQPYSELAYRYLSSGSPASGTPPGRDFGIAYQAMATDRSLILIMPLNAFGFWGPLSCRAGLLRMVREVVAFVSDLAFGGVKPQSRALTGVRQVLNRMAVSGFSAGAIDAARLFQTATIADLSQAYRSAKGDKVAAGYADRLDRLKAPLWQSSAQEIERCWHEFYSIDGDFQKLTGRAFPDDAVSWFKAHEERMLRVYATQTTTPDPATSVPAGLLKTKLGEVFKGVSPKEAVRAGDPGFAARQWQREDGRATLAWFSQNYMKFTGVERMPTGTDEHHTIPRVVVSHAVAQSRFVPM
ncbi:hypothetical protein [Paraburkholderia ferrariae]|uniref:Uncharacterized protein n=1 Tax=Paraburkholderia ferrariae TaxID=386056 RepID=A0ABU9S0K5_9BURK